MDNNDLISDELLARYLEHNLSETERKTVLEYMAAHPDSLVALSIAAQEIAIHEMEQLDNSTDRVGIYHRSLTNKDNLDDDTRYAIAGHGKTSFAAAGSDSSVSCAIQAQQQILGDYGIYVSKQELTQVAKEQGWYVESLGSPIDFVGELLNYYHVPAVQMRNANLYHLFHELGQGHKVIVGIDLNDLAQDGKWQQFDDVLYGKEANHVLVVAGIDTEDAENPKIVLSDPSHPDNPTVYPAKQFMGAWEDSGFFMVSTTTPAPLQYNPEMQHFDYQSGHIKQIADIAYQEIIKRLADDGFLSKKDPHEPYRRFLFFLILVLLVFGGATFAWLYFSPFSMNITLNENPAYQIPTLPFTEGKLTVTYDNLQPQTYLINNENMKATLNDVSYKHKGHNARIQFAAAGFLPLDTILPIQKNIALIFRHDDSKSVIFGTVIDSRNSLPLNHVELSVQGITVYSDAAGHFQLFIPYKQQAGVQTLKAYKSGYELWSGTFEPSITNGWDIVLIAN